MKLDCAVISDLLPLYGEGLASAASRALVEEHLAGCAACAAELEALKADSPPITAAALPMSGISRDLKKRRWLAALLAASLALALATAFLAFGTQRNYLSWQQAQHLLHFTPREGFVQVDIAQPGVYAMVQPLTDPDNPALQGTEISLYTRRFDSRPGQDSLLLPEPSSGQRLSAYYVKPGEPSVLAYGADLFPDGGFMVLPRLALIYYIYLAAGLALALGLLLLLLRRQPRAAQALRLLLGLPLAYLGGHLLVKGFYTISDDSLLRDFLWILACAAFLYIAWLAFWALRRHPGQGRLP